MFRKIQELRLLKAIVQLSKNPLQTKYVYRIGDTMLDMVSAEEVAKHTLTALAYPGFKELWEERYYTPLYDVKALSAYPANTLAHHYGIFMHKHKFTPDWYPYREGPELLTYLRNRWYQVHDTFHTLTGFDGQGFGEIGVQAFYMGQMPDQPFPCAVLSSAFLTALERTPAERRKLLEIINIGYAMGKNAKPVLFRKLENDWNTDISTLREEMRIQPYAEGIHSIS